MIRDVQDKILKLKKEKEKAGYAPRFNNTDIQDGGKCFARD